MNTKTSNHTDVMLAHMPIAVALYDAQDFRLLDANTLYHTFVDTLLGPAWIDGQTIGHSLNDFLPGAEESGVLTIFRTVVQTGIPYHSEEFSFTFFKCGITYWNWTLAPVRDTGGRVFQLVQTITEVTTQVMARQQAERVQMSLSQTNLLVEAERKRLEVIETVARSVQETLDTSSISMAAIQAISTSFDPVSVYTYIANPIRKTLDLLHIQPQIKEPLLRNIQHVPYNSSFPIAQAHKRHSPIIIEDLQTAPSLGVIDSSNPLVMSGAQGYVCVPLWFGDTFEGTLTALFKERLQPDSPEVQALMGTGIYIAAAFAHARHHVVIENERARLRAILDQLPEGVVITEASSSCISYANAAAAHILGIPVTNLVGIPINQPSQINVVTRVNNQTMVPWQFTIIRALGGETVSSQEAVVTRQDGSKVVTLSSSAPLRAEDGGITGAVIVFQDISAQKSVEQQKNEFLSIASHELRTPITAIQGFAEILQMQAVQGQALDRQSLRALDIINEQSQCLSRLIGEMLDLTRIENAKLSLNIASHDLIHTLTSVVETQRASAGYHHLQLILDGISAADKLLGNFDENRIVQVLNNLISNAIKYSPSGSEIEIGLRYAPGTPREALMWVKDSGIGIAAGDLPRIFKRFYRASALDRSISGLGIGLYLVQELITRHGGRVWAESVEGSGSIFYVQLPLDAPPT